ncbi:hypothetical protein CEP54_014675 [Fusarium duplospermum]|uniref:Uncharacterized protein n=1 Tax=Fusarium duplospermum TaxID=1325734 RepID=A0A428NUJ7_9HYPO|nr:hypothetical protein CEP54_014675 [Fusarium duplospermum]
MDRWMDENLSGGESRYKLGWLPSDLLISSLPKRGTSPPCRNTLEIFVVSAITIIFYARSAPRQLRMI